MKRIAALSLLLVMQHAAFADVPTLPRGLAQANPGAALGLPFPRTPTGGTLYTGHLPVAHVGGDAQLGLAMGVDVDEQRAGLGLALDSYRDGKAGYTAEAQLVSPALGANEADGTTSYQPPAGLEVVLSIGFCMR